MLSKARTSRITRLHRRFLPQKVLISNQKAKTAEKRTLQFRLTTNSVENETPKLKPRQTKKEAKVSRPSRPRANKRILHPLKSRNPLNPRLIRFWSLQFQILNRIKSRLKRVLQMIAKNQVELNRQKQPSCSRTNTKRYRRKTKHWTWNLKQSKRFSRARLLMLIRKEKLVPKSENKNPSHHHKKVELTLKNLKPTSQESRLQTKIRSRLHQIFKKHQRRSNRKIRLTRPRIILTKYSRKWSRLSNRYLVKEWRMETKMWLTWWILTLICLWVRFSKITTNLLSRSHRWKTNV